MEWLRENDARVMRFDAEDPTKRAAWAMRPSVRMPPRVQPVAVDPDPSQFVSAFTLSPTAVTLVADDRLVSSVALAEVVDVVGGEAPMLEVGVRRRHCTGCCLGSEASVEPT